MHIIHKIIVEGKLLEISILNDFLGDGLKITKVQHFFVNAVSHYFSGKSYMSIVELIKLGIGISKPINVTVFML